MYICLIKLLMMFYKILILLIFIINSLSLTGQRFGIGASGMYNFQTESFGYGFRVEFPRNRFSIVPQFAYYPSFNKINEYYIGVGLNYNLFDVRRWTFYAIIHPGYNRWINYNTSAMEKAKLSNYNLEGGFGLKFGICLKPFLEYRYNIKWKESHLQAGFVYFIGCKKKSKTSVNYAGKRSKKGSCNAYN